MSRLHLQRRQRFLLVCIFAANFYVHSRHDDSPWAIVVSADAAAFARHVQTTIRSKELVARSRIRTSESSHCRCSSFRPNVVDATRTTESYSTRTILQNSPKSRLGRRLIPPQVLEDLASGAVQFPYTCELFPNFDVPRKSLFWKPPPPNADESSVRSSSHQQDNKSNKNKVIVMTIRLLQHSDIQTVTDICCQEYGVGDVAANLPKTLTTAIQSANAFKALNQLAQDLLDDFVLRLHVEVTMRLKAVQGPPPSSSISDAQQQPPPPDHAVLLLTLSDNHTFQKSHEEIVVGMVEVSRQPPIPERNPSAFPAPLIFKQLYCWWWSVSQQQKRQLDDIMTSHRSPFTSSNSKKQPLTHMNTMVMKQPEGWITNVLVAPEFRGQGWAKVLVHACEGVARSWNVPAIHLHCDANGVSGRVAQQLYTSMGYNDEASSCIVNGNENESSLSSTSSEFDWIKLAAQSEAAAKGFTTTEPVMCSSSVYVIEGIPLLYLKKNLV
jgi:ribosomal protein S18 acetylase RimI-like enzyme